MIPRKILIVALIAGLLIPAVGQAQSIRIEAEAYSDFNDLALNLIQTVVLTGCSSGHVLWGLDVEGEWVEYEFPVSTFGIYSFSLSQKAVVQVPYHFQVILTGGTTSEVQTIDVNFIGSGLST